MRWLFLFAFGIRLFAAPFDAVAPSTSDEIASLNADLIIEGYVSAASGQMSLVQTDLYVKGAQDLQLQRTYISPQIHGSYHDDEKRDRLELGKALRQLHAKGWVVLPHLWAGYNSNSPYFLVRDSHGTVLEFQIEGTRGHLKTSGYGCSNLRGEEPSAEADIRNIELWVEGDRVRVIWPSGKQRIYQSIGAGLCRLETELLPNGKAIRYTFNNQDLACIFTTDQSGKHTYACIERIEDQQYKSPDGRVVKFFYETREIKGKYKKGSFVKTVTDHFPVLMQASNPTYSNVMGYNERTLLISYDAKSYPISCTYWQEKKSPCRIRTFSTPSGTTSFAYDLPVSGKKGGATTVTHPNGSKTVYRFNASYLPTAIENWFEEKLYNQKLFFYDDKQHISRIETQDGKGNRLLAKIYECDQAGNPVIETREGDFGIFTIRRTYSKNRIVKEEHSDGLGFEYTFMRDTHLLTSKTVLSNGIPIRKTTYTYDEAQNLIEEAEQDKTITNYLLIQEENHLHMPEWKIEKDWEGNLIHKTRFSYDQFGEVAKKAHYGSDGHFAYETTYLYDSSGNLLEETNSLGQTARFEYDARGRQIREIPFSQNLTIQRTFDGKGRLTLLQEGDHTTHIAYNSSDELIRKIDYLGLETRFDMHPIHGKPIRIKKEPILQEMDYDDFGREISRKDAYSATTFTEPNSYGDPLTITYPDGGKELFSYAPNRNLLTRRDPDGLNTTYAYDPLKRTLSQTVGSCTTTYFYDAYHLLKEKDPLGATTTYHYNPSGQKIEESRGVRTTRFSYDPLGFLSKKEIGSRWTSFQNDVLGRVLTKSIDGHLNTTYTYDPASNLASITRKESTHFLYDPYNRLIETLQADGLKTTISYEEGHCLLIKTIHDPKGAQFIETYNGHDLLLKFDVPGCLLEEYTYDRALRLATQDRIAFTYTPEGNLSSQTEAGRKTTAWTYTPGGKIKTKTKPDGTRLTYEYTPDGDLAQVGSREFCYDPLKRLIGGTGFSREYDIFGNVIKEELATGLTVETTFDDSDRPLIRTLPDQSCILYEYNGPFLTRVSRTDASSHLLYSHTYDQFDSDGRLLSETGAFTTTYSYDRLRQRTYQTNPYYTEELAYDPAGNLIQKGSHSYRYDDAKQLLSSQGEFLLQYDTHYNRTTQNGTRIPIDSLNRIEGLPYDANGNLTFEGFVFDEFDQLIQTTDEMIQYDALGRRLKKADTSYLYFGDEEVGAYEDGEPKELKVSGMTDPVAIEIDQQPYFPVLDVQGSLRFLIDPATSSICQENTCDPFGVGLNSKIPYAYAGKRYDLQTGLVYFGKRYYIPTLGRWLTPDPMGPFDHSNLYQYVFNNPFYYQDPTGEFAIAIPLIIWGAELALPTITALIYGAATGAAIYGGYKLSGVIYDHCSQGETLKSDESVSPPHSWDTLGDGTKSPAEGYEWKGRGKPGSSQGSWVRGNGKDTETLHPDFNHGPPIGPHWDYDGPVFPDGVRLFPNGSWSPK